MQLDIRSLLERPDSYPYPVKNIEIRDTHISWVFLVDDLAYKVKKEISLFDGILDFTTIQLRKKYCEKEVQLNRVMCPDIYLGVIPITENGISSMNETAPEKIVEWAVKMRRMPEEYLMSRLLQNNEEIPLRKISEIARTLVDFHSQCEARPEFGSMEKVTRKIDENFETVLMHRPVDKAYIDRVHNFMSENEELFHQRAESGRVLRFHGDLQSNNIVLAPKKVYIFDCVEFTDLFAAGDVAEELGFLAMDLDFWERSDLAKHLIDEYVRFSNDKDMIKVLNFFKSYRAFVRAKVNIFTALGTENEQIKAKANEMVNQYLELAYSYI
ncbi:MAG: phosphotransferase [Promethearchaeota archaeon]